MGVLIISAVLFEVYIKAPDFWKGALLGEVISWALTLSLLGWVGLEVWPLGSKRTHTTGPYHKDQHYPSHSAPPKQRPTVRLNRFWLRGSMAGGSVGLYGCENIFKLLCFEICYRLLRQAPTADQVCMDARGHVYACICTD